MVEEKKGVVEERPNFGNRQVRKVSEIEWGKKYRKHWGNGSKIITLIQRDGKSQWIKIRKKSDYGMQIITDMSLADLGVIPYENGMWNVTNWVEKLE